MRKKILSTILFIILLIILGFSFGGIAKGEEKISECCELRHSIRMGGVLWEKGCVVAAPEDTNPWCDTNNNGINDAEGGDGVFVDFTEDWASMCLIDTIMTATDWTFYILLLISVVIIIFGAFTYMTSGGNSDKINKAKGIIVYAVIGIIVALLARLVPSIVNFILSV